MKVTLTEKLDVKPIEFENSFEFTRKRNVDEKTLVYS